MDIEFTWPFLEGQFQAGYGSWMDFMDKTLGVVNCPASVIYREFSKSAGPTYTMDEFCVVSARPKEIHLKSGSLHKDGGPAVLYADGFCVYALNGVVVPKHIAESKPMDFQPEWFTKESNVEIRREVVRKFGVEQVCSALKGKIIHSETVITTMDNKKHPYELWEFDLGENIGTCPCLKMTNPSLGLFHMEWVPPGTSTVQEALEFRNGGSMPSIIT